MKDVASILGELTSRSKRDSRERLDHLVEKHASKVIRLCKRVARRGDTILRTVEWKTGRRVLCLPSDVDEVEFWRQMAKKIGLSFDWECNPKGDHICKLRWAYKFDIDWVCSSDEEFEEWAASFGGDDREKRFWLF